MTHVCTQLCRPLHYYFARYGCKLLQSACLCVCVFVCVSTSISQQESPLQLTDPRDADARRMLNVSYRIICIQQLSRVKKWFDGGCDQQLTDDHQKFMTLTETISRSRDLVSAHQNLNGLRDLTTPLSGLVCHLWASTCHHQPTYQI